VYSTEAYILYFCEKGEVASQVKMQQTLRCIKLMLNTKEISRHAGSPTPGPHQNFRKQTNAQYTNLNLQWELKEFSYLASIPVARVGHD